MVEADASDRWSREGSSGDLGWTQPLLARMRDTLASARVRWECLTGDGGGDRRRGAPQTAAERWLSTPLPTSASPQLERLCAHECSKAPTPAFSDEQLPGFEDKRLLWKSLLCTRVVRVACSGGSSSSTHSRMAYLSFHLLMVDVAERRPRFTAGRTSS